MATGQVYDLEGTTLDAAAEPALAFLRTTVLPEYRGPDSGFFDDEVAASAGATSFVQLLCFAGREPAWR